MPTLLLPITMIAFTPKTAGGSFDHPLRFRATWGCSGEDLRRFAQLQISCTTTTRFVPTVFVVSIMTLLFQKARRVIACLLIDAPCYLLHSISSQISILVAGLQRLEGTYWASRCSSSTSSSRGTATTSASYSASANLSEGIGGETCLHIDANHAGGYFY